MKNSKLKNSTTSHLPLRPSPFADPEAALQANEALHLNPFAIFVLWLVGKLLAVWFWLTCRTECAWCHRWLAGNPCIRKRKSHGICPACSAKVFAVQSATAPVGKYQLCHAALRRCADVKNN